MRRSTRALLDAVAAPLPDVVAIPLMPLECGRVTLVSACDVDMCDGLEWRYVNGYAAICAGQVKPVYLHRVILNAPNGLVVDHRNNDTLDNTRGNIHVVTASQNVQAKRKSTRRVMSSQWKGVTFCGRSKSAPWHARVDHRYIGSFSTELDASLAYDAAAREQYGPHAALNHPRPGERGALVALSHGFGLRDVA